MGMLNMNIWTPTGQSIENNGYACNSVAQKMVRPKKRLIAAAIRKPPIVIDAYLKMMLLTFRFMYLRPL
jgi:hypothetical protein